MGGVVKKLVVGFVLLWTGCILKNTEQIQAEGTVSSSSVILPVSMVSRFPSSSSAKVVSSQGTISSSSFWTHTGPLFVAKDSMQDQRDNRVYRTVQIGNQIWFAENLDYGAPKGALNPYGSLYAYSQALALPSFCDSLECKDSLIQIRQGMCPGGWHVSTDEDWLQLEFSLGMPESELYSTEWERGAPLSWKLMSTQAWQNKGTDNYGFNLLAGGTVMGGNYVFEGLVTSIWSPTIAGNSPLLNRNFNHNYGGIFRSAVFADWRSYVRCVKNRVN